MTVSKGCVLGLGVVLPHDSNLEASIIVASPMQSGESLDQDQGKLFCLKITIGLPTILYQRRAKFYESLFSKERKSSS